MEDLVTAFLEPSRPGKAHCRPGLVSGLSHLMGLPQVRPLQRLALVKVTCQPAASQVSTLRQRLWREAGKPEGLQQGKAREAVAGRGASPATSAVGCLTLEVASAVATRVHPGCAIVADAPHHALAAGLHHPQVASHLPPEPRGR